MNKNIIIILTIVISVLQNIHCIKYNCKIYNNNNADDNNKIENYISNCEKKLDCNLYYNNNFDFEKISEIVNNSYINHIIITESNTYICNNDISLYNNSNFICENFPLYIYDDYVSYNKQEIDKLEIFKDINMMSDMLNITDILLDDKFDNTDIINDDDRILICEQNDRIYYLSNKKSNLKLVDKFKLLKLINDRINKIFGKNNHKIFDKNNQISFITQNNYKLLNSLFDISDIKNQNQYNYNMFDINKYKSYKYINNELNSNWINLNQLSQLIQKASEISKDIFIDDKDELIITDIRLKLFSKYPNILYFLFKGENDYDILTNNKNIEKKIENQLCKIIDDSISYSCN